MILYWGAILLSGLVAFIIAQTFFQDESEYKASEALETGENSKSENLAKHGIVLRYSRPFFRRFVTPIVSSLKGKKKIRERYRRLLASSGLNEVLTPEDFYSFKLFLIIAFPIVFLALRAFLEETWPLEYVAIVAIVGFFYPDFWIRSKKTNRQLEIIRNMPFAVDMLALSVEAGLDFVAAMGKVIEKAKPNPFSHELEIFMKETKIGASRPEGLRNLAWRIDLMQVSSFSATLIAADSVGANIAPILKALSIEMRQKKFAEVEKRGAAAATKILIPMIFLIIPAVFIAIAAPMILEMMVE